MIRENVFYTIKSIGAFYCILMSSIVNNLIAQTKNTNEIIQTYSNLSRLSARFEETTNDENISIDSIEKLNKNLVTKILKIDKKDINYIKYNTDIRFIISQDKKVIFISWDVGLNDRIPSYNNILCFSNSKSKITAQLYPNSNNFIGSGFYIDSIYEIRLKHTTIYLISKCSKCSIGTCMHNKLTALKIKNDSLIENFKVFKKKENFFSEIDFEYYINKDIDNDLSFSVNYEKKIVYAPLLNTDKTKVIGKLSYFILDY